MVFYLWAMKSLQRQACLLWLKHNHLFFLPNANFYGKDSFSFLVSDVEHSVSGNVQIDIKPIDDLPMSAGELLLADFSEDELNGRQYAVKDLLINVSDIEKDDVKVVEKEYQGLYGKLVFKDGNWFYQYNHIFIFRTS